MTQEDKANGFDRHASGYRRMHAQAIRASGEPPDFFAEAKVRYMVSHLQRHPSSLLDFGCGVGGTLGPLTRAFPRARLHGVDESTASLEIATRDHPHVSLSAIDAQRIPLRDGEVEAAMAACVFHHIAVPHRVRWIRELHRVVRPGGRVFVFEHNPLNPLTRAAVRACEFDAGAVLLRRREAHALLHEAGFTAIRGDYITFFPRVLSALRPLERHLGRLPLGAQYVVHGVAT